MNEIISEEPENSLICYDYRDIGSDDSKLDTHFVHFGKSWNKNTYFIGKNYNDEIVVEFKIYKDDGEIIKPNVYIRWKSDSIILRTSTDYAALILDNQKTRGLFHDIIHLAQKPIEPQDVCNKLIQMGLKDETKTFKQSRENNIFE